MLTVTSLTSGGGKITNCITKIPQHIDLELVDGVVTLKAGSKVYIPNGFESDGTTRKFDVIVTDEDYPLSAFNTLTGKVYLILRKNKSTNEFSLTFGANGYVLSGDADPALSSGMYYWYDTTNNLIKYWNGTSFIDYIFSLPIAAGTRTSGVLTSIDQVFNGLGYIGAICYVLPDVIFLASHGRKSDGTVSNYECVVDKVLMNTGAVYAVDSGLAGTPSGVKNGVCYITTNQTYTISETSPTTSRWYQPSTNKFFLYRNSAWQEDPQAILADVTSDGTNITSLKPRQAFRAVGFSDKAEVAGWGMPSDKYVDLTLGESRSTYTAPASGYFVIKKGCGTGNILYMWNQNNGMIAEYALNTANSSFDAKLFIPVKKGDSIYIFYNLTGTTGMFRFIYAEGAQ